MNIDFVLNQELTNHKLEVCFENIFKEQTEQNHLSVVNAINESKYLIPIMAKEEDIIKEEDGTLKLSENAGVQFIGCLNEDSEGFMPLFTNTKEANDFIEQTLSTTTVKDFEVVTLLIDADMAWSMLLNDDNVCGIVINALSTGWVIRREQLETVE